MTDPRDWKRREDGSGEPDPADRPLPPELDPRGRKAPRRSVRAGRPAPPATPVRPAAPSAPRRPGATTAAAGSRSVLPPKPPVAPRRGRRAARVLSWIAVVTSVALLAVAGGGYVLVTQYDGNIQRIGGIFDGQDRPEPTSTGALTILIVGSDSREGLTGAEAFQGKGKEFVTGQRSDTIILAHLYGGSDQAQLISIPRDSYVTIPEYTDPKTGETKPAHEAKINSAFFEGGPPLLIQTVSDLAGGLRIDHYMQVDFAGFTGMVDALGGVEVCLTEPAREPKSGIDLPAGVSTIRGDQALAFVRQREGLPGSDIGRIDRQQRFIAAMVRKVLSAGTLLNPLKLNGFLNTATQSLKVDEDLELGDLRDIALRARDFSANGVSFATLPIADVNARRDRQSVVLLDEIGTAQVFDQLKRDIPPGLPPPPPEAGEALIVAPSAVRVRVFNGAGIPGLGRRAADDLEGVGFALVDAPGNREGAAAETVVLHGPDKADSARTLAAAVPGARVQLDPALDRTLEIVVGSGYAGARPVQVTPATPAPSPSGPPEVVTAAADPCGA